MSNNTVVLEKTEGFEKLLMVAKHIRDNGEPGIMNLINVQKYARYGEQSEDRAWLASPCSEIPLESFELCNLSGVFPTRCIKEDEFYEALGYATFGRGTITTYDGVFSTGTKRILTKVFSDSNLFIV